MRSAIAAAVLLTSALTWAADAGSPPPLMRDETPVVADSDAGVASAAELEKACEAKDGAACLTLGARVEQGREGEKANDSRAAELYRKGCDANDAAACSEFASMLEIGRGVSKSTTRAASLYERSCRAGYGDACALAARLYSHPGAVNMLPDYKAAAQLLELGCDAKDATACVMLGEFHEVGRGVATANAHRAHGYFSRACELGSKGGCNQKERIDRGNTRRPVFDFQLP